MVWDNSLDVRSETSVSGATYTDGSFVGLFYTSKWGDFTKACSRITGFKPTNYRKGTDEPLGEYAVRLRELQEYLNKNFNNIATFKLAYNNYRIEVSDPRLLDASYAIRTNQTKRKEKSSNNSN